MNKLFILISLLMCFVHPVQAEDFSMMILPQGERAETVQILSVYPFQHTIQLEDGCFKGDQTLLMMTAKELKPIQQSQIIQSIEQYRKAGRSFTAMQFFLHNERVNMNILDTQFVAQFCMHQGKIWVDVDGYVVETQSENRISHDYFIFQAKPSQSTLTDVVED